MVSSAMPQFSVLGPLEVRDTNGSAHTIDSVKQRLLLAALLIHNHQTLSTDRLADILWGDSPPADPSAALQNHVSRLRKRLQDSTGLDCLRTDSYGYRYTAQPETIDAALFERWTGEARSESDPARALVLMDRALALWRGPAYAEFADLDFARSESTRLGELRMGSREFRGELLLNLGRHDEAASHLETLAAEDPLRERPRSLLMQALYQCGRQSEALAVLQQFRRLLSEELGIEPSPALQQLEQQILGHDLGSGLACPPLAAPDLPFGIAFEYHPLPELEISYLDLGNGRSLAYGAVGEGPTVVVVPAFVTNLTTIAEGKDPRSGLLAGLSESFRLVLYDRLGTGLSAADNDDFSLEVSTAELRAVVEHLELGPVPVIANSCAGPAGLALASQSPERVSHLVLIGTLANAPRAFDREDLRASMLSLVRAHWGIASKIMVDMMFPGADPEIGQRFAKMQREAATPEAAARCLEALYESDVSELLPRVHTPSLVIHYTEDRAFPFRAGRELAASLPNARFLPLSGRWHLPSENDLPRVVRLVTEFLKS